MADLREDAFTLGRDGVVFHMQQRQSPGEVAAGFGGMTASGLHPMDVEFGLKMLRRGAGINLIQHGASIALKKLLGMVVVTQRHSSAPQHSACGIESGNEITHLSEIRHIDAGWIGINRMSDAKLTQVIRRLLRLIQNHFRRLVA